MSPLISDTDSIDSIDEQSHSHGSSTNKASSISAETNNESIKKDLAQQETTNVFRLRVLVIIILILAAAGVSVLVYSISQRAENDEFNTQFEGATKQLEQVFTSLGHDKISALGSLALATIAHGVDHIRTWPFVALSSFQQRSLTARVNSGALEAAIYPYVPEEDRAEWEEYVVSHDAWWIQEAIIFQKTIGFDQFVLDYGPDFSQESSYPIKVVVDGTDDIMDAPNGTGPYMPRWETSPVLRRDRINVDDFQDLAPTVDNEKVLNNGKVLVGGLKMAPPGGMYDGGETGRFAQLLSIQNQEETEYLGDPMTSVFIPIFDSFNSTRKPVAVLHGLLRWATYFENIIPENIAGLDIVLRNPCYESYTYRVNGAHVEPRGLGDLHEAEFEHDGVDIDSFQSGKLTDGTALGLEFDETCPYSISIYPSQAFADRFENKATNNITLAVAGIFAFAILMFLIYDRLVERRQALILQKAVQSTAIVSSLFPKNVRDRLMQTTHETDNSATSAAFRNQRLKSLINIKEDSERGIDNNKPIADLFPNCTVMFADISGFTAWSSTREPAQVFTLLQTLYQAFDKIAIRRKVFKVETIGDSYVAVTGLPEPQTNHASIMAKFAKECLLKINQVTQDLEVSLGPDTADLSMRFGLHSGPVTAGVLRGDRARFQLFGDTVNTAARMESTGMRGRIQISQSTADLLSGMGRDTWFTARKDAVNAKGLGTLKTFWLEPNGKRESFSDEDESKALTNEEISTALVSSKHARLIDWMCEVLAGYIKQIVAKRSALGLANKKLFPPLRYNRPAGKTCLDEVVEAISLPKFNAKGIYDPDSVTLPEDASAQLRAFVTEIASHYQGNPFHNFDHACHVTMSVHKLLKRVVTPDISEEDLEQAKRDTSHLASRLHDYTHGINSDPITLFGIVFGALIHDVDHRGVSNVQLGKERPELAEYYRNKSVAEQNSMDIAWDLLMCKKYDFLRSFIFSTQMELIRFRQVVVNLVLATDIFDKELNDLRKQRWNKAFFVDEDGKESRDEVDNNLRATIVLEHIIQASDVSHTMQHWHIYLKWNRRLFKEMTRAFRAGRMAVDPAKFWYQGELKFFDGYVIPLARKLQECQVFGVSSDEYLNYARSNRSEWEAKGKGVLEAAIAEIAAEEMSSSDSLK